MDKKEQDRVRAKRYRDKKRDDFSVTLDSVTAQSVTEYPPVIYALTDSVRRGKLEAIVQSLRNHKQADNVFYGVSGLTMETVGELLDCVKCK